MTRWRWWQGWLLVGSSWLLLWAWVTPTRETSALPMYVAFKTATVTVTALPAPSSKQVTVRPTAVYVGTRAAVVNRQRYVRVKTLTGRLIGWVPQQQIRALTHVTAHGQLSTRQYHRLNGRLTAKHPVKVITVTAAVPATKATVKQWRVQATQLTTTAMQVVATTQTDLGRYYLIERYQHRYGWVSAADFKYHAVSVPTITAKNWLHVDHLVATQHIQGTLLVAQAGQATPTIRSYGLADRATHTRNGATTVYPIASLQKAMTGVMIGQLVASGQLQLDQPIGNFYPHLKNARHITIQQLLNHTSGLYMPEVAPKTPLTEAQAVQWSLSHVTVQTKHQWRYCSANYTLLAGIIRQVTGKSYAENLTTRVLKPAGMTATKAWTQFHNLPVATPYFATNHFFVQTAQISLPLLSSELGAGDIGTTVTDYYRFVTAFNDGTLLPAATRQLLTSTRTNDYAAGLYYGLDGKQHATGYDNDISNFYNRSTNGKVTVVFFMNQANHYRAKDVVQKITEILAKNQ